MPAWSPTITSDGKKVVFLSNQSGSNQVWVAGIDGAGPKRITDADQAFNPMPSPDGRYVYYTNQFIWRVPIEGGKPAQLTTMPANTPRISPDGKLILCRIRTATPEGALWRTALLDADSGKVVRLMTIPRTGGPVLGWSPDGRSIVAVDWKGGVGNLWEENIDGTGEPRQITDFTRGVIYSFDFSRDGKSIAMLHAEPRSDVVILRNFR
ncbi:MAG: TolB family protein [Thermoanaerobaculia bacterium]